MSTKTKAADAAPAAVTSAITESQEIAAKGFEKTLATLKEGVEKASKGFETSQAKVKENMEKAMKTAEEAVAFSQGNFEAFVKASQVFTAGLQDISKHLAAATQASVDDSVSFTKALVGVKSVKEVVDLQASYARSAIEKAVAETGKLTDASVKLAEQSFAPITARVTLAVEKFGKSI
jgi:phasin family protein